MLGFEGFKVGGLWFLRFCVWGVRAWVLGLKVKGLGFTWRFLGFRKYLQLGF